jgi:hypothetical protein
MLDVERISMALRVAGSRASFGLHPEAGEGGYVRGDSFRPPLTFCRAPKSNGERAIFLLRDSEASIKG